MASTPDPARTLVAVFTSPVTDYLLHFGGHLGFRTVLLDPEQERLDRLTEAQRRYIDIAATAPREEFMDGTADILVTDDERPELGPLLRDVLAMPSRWVGVTTSARRPAPYQVALREQGVAEEQIARIHHPSGLNVGAVSAPEIVVAVLAGLLADRNGLPGGTSFGTGTPAPAQATA